MIFFWSIQLVTPSIRPRPWLLHGNILLGASVGAAPVQVDDPGYHIVCGGSLSWKKMHGTWSEPLKMNDPNDAFRWALFCVPEPSYGLGLLSFFFVSRGVGLRPVGFVDLWDEWNLVGEFLKLHQGLSSTAACQAPGGQCWFGQGAVGGLGCPVLMRDGCNPKTVHHFTLFLRGGWGAICGCENLAHFFGQSCSYIWNSVVSNFGTALWNTFNIRIRRETKDAFPCRGPFVTQPLPVSLCILLSTDWLYSLFLIRYFDSQKRLKLWNSYFFKICVSVQSHIPKSKVA